MLSNSMGVWFRSVSVETSVRDDNSRRAAIRRGVGDHPVLGRSCAARERS
jgi:hypothetical protein